MSNFNKYTYLRMYHMASGLVLSLLFVFGPRKKKRVIFNSTHNRSYNFNSKYLFEYFLKQPGWECKFVVDDDIKREKLISEVGPYFITSRGLRNKIYCLLAGVWVTSSMETPVGGIFLSVRRLVYHLGHGVPIKSIGLAEKSITWYKRLYYRLVRTNFTCFLATSEFMIEPIRRFVGVSANKVVVHSQPRLEPLIPFVSSQTPKRPFKILYAPTWRHYREVELFPFQDFQHEKLAADLERLDCEVHLRLHPYYENSKYLESFKGGRVKSLSSKLVPEIMDVLHEYDMVITDYSSIYVDYLLLDRPIAFFAYDLAEYKEKVGFLVDFENLSPGPKAQSYAEFIQYLEQVRTGKDAYVSERERVNALLNGKVIHPCEENYSFVTHQAESSLH